MMLDEDLREQFAAWAGSLSVVVPEVSVIRRRMRRRIGRLGVGGAVLAAVAGTAAGVVLSSLPAAGRPALSPAATSTPALSPAATSTPALSPTATSTPARHPPQLAAAPPYYVTIGSAAAVVRRTASGAVTGTISPPRGGNFSGVAAAAGDRTFVLAAGTRSGIRFYRLHLDAAGRPGPLHLTPIPPIRRNASACPAQLAGLAVSPDGRHLAISLLSNCPTGNAGASEIEVARLANGAVMATWQPGNGYPEWLSWTTSGTLAYQWGGPKPGVWVIPDATSQTSPGPRLLIADSTGIGGFTGAGEPMIAPDGSDVIVTLFHGNSLEVAEFSARTGRPQRVLIPAVSNPVQYCGPLWTDAPGHNMLAACGDGTETAVTNGHLTHLRTPWRLPDYPVPGPPLIAW
jgi:hypothetical protein